VFSILSRKMSAASLADFLKSLSVWGHEKYLLFQQQ
jgi:hypothetical protein